VAKSNGITVPSDISQGNQVALIKPSLCPSSSSSASKLFFRLVDFKKFGLANSFARRIVLHFFAGFKSRSVPT
jgi:hypothetical protein